MSRRLKKTYGNWTVSEISSQPRRRGKVLETIHEVNSNAGSSNDQFDRLCKSPMKREVSFKPLSFWAKKVEDLQRKEKKPKVKELYELSSPDETTPNPSKRKYRKPKPRKKKENLFENIISKKAALHLKKKQTSQQKIPNEGALIKERVLFKRAEDNLDLSLLTFKAQLPFFGLSSTPGKGRRPNLVKPSYFDFVSPIVEGTLKVERGNLSQDFGNTTTRDLPVDKTGNETDSTPKRGINVEKNSPVTFCNNQDPSDSDDRHVSLSKDNENLENSGFCGFSPCDLQSPFDKHVTLRRRRNLESTDYSLTDGPPNNSSNDCGVVRKNSTSLELPILDGTDATLSNTFCGTPKENSRVKLSELSNANDTSNDTHGSYNSLCISEEEQTSEQGASHSYSNEELAKCNLPVDHFVTRQRPRRTIGRVADKENEPTPPKRKSSVKELTITKDNDVSHYFMKRTILETPPSLSDSSLIYTSSPEDVTIQAIAEPLHENNKLEPVDDTSPKTSPVGNKTLLQFGNSVVLKGGKSHTRALSVLRQLNAGRLTLHNQSMVPQAPPGRGRGYETFVESLLENQPGFEESILASTTRNSMPRKLRFSHTRCSFIQTRESRLFTRPSVAVRQSTRCSNRRLTSATNDRTNRTVQWRDSVMGKLSNEIVETSVHEAKMNRTHFGNMSICVVAQEDHKPTAFRSAYGIDEPVRGKMVHSTPRQVMLAKCGQTEILDFSEHFNEETLPDCLKIGEGVYGEVFMYNSAQYGPTVLKVIPIEGDLLVNDEPQKTFKEILSEVVITMELSNLRNGTDQNCSGYAELRKCWCVKGEYPELLLDLWCSYDVDKGSDNDSPNNFDQDQLYIIFELAHGGRDLEAFVFQNAKQSAAAFCQTALSLAVAENALKFEHRDLHWGNVLLSATHEKTVKYMLNGEEHIVPTEGVKVTIIDFTLSRMTYEGCSVFNDLSVDPGLFTSEGEYQFEIYRLMKEETGNNWECFKPRTNIFWLHYILDKLSTVARYARPRSKIHLGGLEKIRKWKNSVLNFSSAAELISLL